MQLRPSQNKVKASKYHRFYNFAEKSKNITDGICVEIRWVLVTFLNADPQTFVARIPNSSRLRALVNGAPNFTPIYGKPNSCRVAALY